MVTTPNPVNGERENSQERELRLGRLKKVQAFINDVLKPADVTLGEQKAQRDEVRQFESRPYQLEAWDALWRAREEGKDRGLIHLATGLGKTSVAVFDYAKFRKEQEAKGESARALFVVHQNAILDQADERFNEVLPHLLPGVGMSRFSNQADSLPTGEVVFASFQSLNTGAHKFDPKEFDYIVYDEAHHIEAKTYKKVVEYFQPKFQLGLTATPERGDEKDITEHFGDALYTKTLPEGIAEEYLADVHYKLMLDEQTKKLLQSGFKPKSMQELKQIFDIEPNLEDVVAAIKMAQQELRDKTGLEKIKTIIFDPSITTSDEMARLMGGSSYHSGRGKSNAATFEAFCKGDLETIVTRDMFNEGVDIPDALLLVFRRSTQSKTVFEQQLGRGLRKTDQKSEVTVLDFVANAERIRLLRELAKEIREKRLNRTGSGTVGEADGDGESHLSISAGDNEFIFDQQIIDILALYDYFQEKNKERVDWSLWSNEEIIDLAKQLSPNEPLTQLDIRRLAKENEFPNHHIIYSRFGSMPNFQRLCGFEAREDWSAWTNEKIIELALELSPNEPLSSVAILDLSKENIFLSVTAIARRFGSLSEFQRACGFEVKEVTNWSLLSNEELIGAALNISPDGPLKARDMDVLANDRRFPGHRLIADRFGSIVAFQRACGFEVKDWSEVTNEGIIAIALSLSPDRPLGVRDMRGDSLPDEKYIADRFGSIVAFQRACGFEVKERTSWAAMSNDDIISLARELSQGQKITIGKLREISKNGGFPSLVVIQKRFGSLTAFQQEVANI